MKKYLFAALPVALMAMGVSSADTWSEDARMGARPDQYHSPASIEGVWRVTRHGVNCATGGTISTFPALMTFHADGTVSGQAVGPGATNAYGEGEFGVWRPQEHSRSLTFRLLSYNYDDAGGIAGSIEVTATAELTGANTLTYKTKVDFYGADGQFLFSGCGAATGLRF